MIQTALSAILVTLATPLQFGLSMVVALPAALVCRRVIKSDKVYARIEVEEREQYLDFCLEHYCENHPQTKKARQLIESIIKERFKQKHLDLEDLGIYCATGLIDESLVNRLTARIKSAIL